MTGLATIIFSSRDWLLPATLLVVAAAAWVWAGHRSSTPRHVRIGCGLLKFAGVLLLAISLLEPLWVGQRARPGANFFGLIADNSQSLKIHDSGQEQSRGEQLRAALTGETKGWRAALEEQFQVRRYLMDARLQTSRDFGDLDFEGRASSIGHALKTATEQWRGQPVAGLFLFTDGNATDLGGELPNLDGCPPIYPVLIGRDANITDLSLEKGGVSQTAFEDAPVTVQVQVQANGVAGAGIVTRLTEVATGTSGTNQADYKLSTSAREVGRLQQSAKGTESDLNFRFQIQPDKPGLHFYELETRLLEESVKAGTPSREATLVNNRQMIVVDRGQQPFRVLYVSGRPNWEYKFLNRAIQEDPQVQMVSLIRIARREPKFQIKGRAGETSNPLFRGFDQQDEDRARYDQPVLIRLNTRDEFELRGGFPKTVQELFQYQAIILADVEAGFFTQDQMSLVQRFVSERGGGFLMLGGAESFREGNYAGSSIASILPIYLDRAPEATPVGALKLNLTRDGWLQPWTRLRATEPEENLRLQSMPAFEIFNPVSAVKPGASVLATVTDDEARSHPALVVQRFGLGRSGAMMVGDMWRWGLRDEVMLKDLGKSWRQLVRWLVSDVPSPIMVAAEPAPGGDASEVRLTVTARDEEFKPLDNAIVRLTVRPVRLSASQADPASKSVSVTNYVQITAEASSSKPGTYEATYIARDAGAYSVEAWVMRADEKIAGHAVTGWATDPATAELHSLKPNRALMETLAKRTGGEVVSLEDLEKFVKRLPERRAPITETFTKPLWHQPLLFLLVLACFVTEWGVRRWKGMP